MGQGLLGLLSALLLFYNLAVLGPGPPSATHLLYPVILLGSFVRSSESLNIEARVT